MHQNAEACYSRLVARCYRGSDGADLRAAVRRVQEAALRALQQTLAQHMEPHAAVISDVLPIVRAFLDDTSAPPTMLGENETPQNTAEITVDGVVAPAAVGGTLGADDDGAPAPDPRLGGSVALDPAALMIVSAKRTAATARAELEEKQKKLLSVFETKKREAEEQFRRDEQITSWQYLQEVDELWGGYIATLVEKQCACLGEHVWPLLQSIYDLDAADVDDAAPHLIRSLRRDLSAARDETEEFCKTARAKQQHEAQALHAEHENKLLRLRMTYQEEVAEARKIYEEKRDAEYATYQRTLTRLEQRLAGAGLSAKTALLESSDEELAAMMSSSTSTDGTTRVVMQRTFAQGRGSATEAVRDDFRGAEDAGAGGGGAEDDTARRERRRRGEEIEKVFVQARRALSNYEKAEALGTIPADHTIHFALYLTDASKEASGRKTKAGRRSRPGKSVGQSRARTILVVVAECGREIFFFGSTRSALCRTLAFREHYRNKFL